MKTVLIYTACLELGQLSKAKTPDNKFCVLIVDYYGAIEWYSRKEISKLL